MGSAACATNAKFTNQRDVVLNERRQTTRTVRMVWRRWRLAALFPAHHPCTGPLVTSPTCRPPSSTKCAHFRLLYRSQCIYRARERHRSGAGARPRRTVFRKIDPGERVELFTGPADRRCPDSFRGSCRAPRLYLAWHTPAMFAEGDWTSTWRPTCSPTARRRASIAGSCSTSAWRPTSRPRRTRAR
jgi:hypothetical protein